MEIPKIDTDKNIFAVIDADFFCYEFGSIKNNITGEFATKEEVLKLVDNRITQIVEGTEADRTILALSDLKNSFRKEHASILVYKGNRKKEKPEHYNIIREYLESFKGEKGITAIIGEYLEGDDILGISSEVLDNENTTIILCSRDKDINTIAGLHYSWQIGEEGEKGFSKAKFYSISTVEADRNFYSQLIIGDTSDNILGLFGLGHKSASVKRIQEYETEEEMIKECVDRYKERFGNLWKTFLFETASLLFIIRKDYKVPDSELFWKQCHHKLNTVIEKL